MKSVFISYKAEEFNEANWVRASLEANGISCWMAPMCIPGGSSYALEIPKAIRECKVFVLVLSAKTQESKWVPREVDQAINEGKTILPFMLEDCPLKDDFHFYLTNVQRYAAYENKEQAIRLMIAQIRQIVGVPAAAAARPAPAPRTAPAQNVQSMQEILGSVFGSQAQPVQKPAAAQQPVPAKTGDTLAGKNRWLVALVCFLLGGLGIHNFMMGEIKRGIVRIALSLLLPSIMAGSLLAFIDLIRILMKKYTVNPNKWL